MLQHATKLIGKPARYRHQLRDGRLIQPGDALYAQDLVGLIESERYHLELEALGIWSDRHDPVAVYVPTCDRMRQIIRPQSAIVGKQIRGEYSQDQALGPGIHLYYQELGKVSNIQTYADGLVHATGRLQHSYPTVASCFCRLDQVMTIGVWDGVTLHLTSPDELVQWMRWDALYEVELHRSDRRLG